MIPLLYPGLVDDTHFVQLNYLSMHFEANRLKHWIGGDRMKTIG